MQTAASYKRGFLDNPKIRAVLHQAFLPLFWLTLSLVSHFFPELPFSKGVAMGLFIGTVIGKLLSERRYLYNIELEGEEIKLTWYTRMFKLRTVTLDLNQLDKIKAKKYWSPGIPDGKLVIQKYGYYGEFKMVFNHHIVTAKAVSETFEELKASDEQS